jgi:Uma2 family endonuclease
MTLAIEQPPPPWVKRWTKREYNELVERGAWQGQHIYLFRGELIEMSPQYHPHAFAITELVDALHLHFGIRQGYKVRVQLPFETPGESMPEPDALVCTDAHFLRQPHPKEAVLVIEVADSSLDRDREKALEYAAAKVPEYWILDVNNRRVELYRDPVIDKTTALGFRYALMRLVEENETIEPLAKSGSAMAIAQFFC